MQQAESRDITQTADIENLTQDRFKKLKQSSNQLMFFIRKAALAYDIEADGTN
jgi:hypothetical protein